MNNDLYPKITDFVLSKVLHSQEDMSLMFQIGFKGTTLYSAPEILNDDDYSYTGDVYSFVMIAYEILTVEVPFGKYLPNYL